MEDIERYLDGALLYGDDFTASQIAQWHDDEKEAYAELGAKNAAAYHYSYHEWNRFHAFRFLPAGRPLDVMGFGGAYGEELLPLISDIERITIVDPSDTFARKSIHGVPARYVKPAAGGELPLASGTFDLVTCLGVLHHIPNVSAVVHELARVLKPGGHIVLREPIVSMGDWRKPRAGLTRRERGIPLAILESICLGAGLALVRESLCGFSLTPHAFRWVRSGPYNSGIITRLDALLARVFTWNVNYHPHNFLQRLRPTSVFLVLRRPAR